MTHKLKAAVDTLTELAIMYTVLLVVCALLFATAEGRGVFESIYWAGTTATSTGYGDISPQTVIGRIVAFFLMHAAIFFVAPMIIVKMMDKLMDNYHEFSDSEQKQLLSDVAEIKEILRDR